MATIVAKASTFDAALKALTPGDTLQLIEDVVFPAATPYRGWGKVAFSEVVTVDLGGHRLSGVYAGRLAGVRFQGGNLTEFRCDTGERLQFVDMESRGAQDNIIAKGVQIVRGADVLVNNVEFEFLKRGLQFTLVDRIDVTRCAFARIYIDGAEFGECHTWRFTWNTGRDFRPVLGAHPDFVQGWSRGTSPPASDIVIADNFCDGPNQGIGLFDHLDYGGFDRVTIARNRLRCGYAQAIALTNARASVLEDNHVSTFEWTPPAPEKLNRASINISGDVRLVGRNYADAGAGKGPQVLS
jgi:hypothetical protein